jgi:hypothetical protein
MIHPSRKARFFSDVALCKSYVKRRFGGTYRLHLQGRIIRERGTKVSRWLQTEPPVENNQLYKNRERILQDFSPLHSVQTDSGTHPASYQMGTMSDFPEGKAARARS